VLSSELLDGFAFDVSGFELAGGRGQAYESVVAMFLAFDGYSHSGRRVGAVDC